MPRVAHEASMRALNRSRSWAVFTALSQVRPLSRSSLSMDQRHVSLGLPLLRLPCVVHRRAIIGRALGDIRSMVLSSVESGTDSVQDSNSWLLILLGQKICLILLRHFVWKVLIFLHTAFVVFQPSNPYMRTLMTL